jgi:hypothetical protein
MKEYTWDFIWETLKYFSSSQNFEESKPLTEWLIEIQEYFEYLDTE